MKEKLKNVLISLPSEGPRESVARMTVARIVEREVERWREKKHSFYLLSLLLVLGVLGIKKMAESMELLGTSDYWAMVRQQPTFLELEAFLEGNPITELLFLIFVILMIIVPMVVLVRKDKWLGRR
jgi:hypothetical protein